MTDQATPANSENGKVVAVAAVIAGVAGGVAVLLNGRRKETKEREALAELLESRRKELTDLSAAVDARRKELAGLVASAGRRGRSRLRDATGATVDVESLVDIDWSSLSNRARKGLERAREEAAKRAPADLNKQREQLARSGTTAVKTARSIGDRAAEEISKRLPELLETVEAELGPRAKTIGDRAVHAAAASAETSRHGVDALRHAVDDAKPHVEELAGKARETVRHAVEEAKPQVEELTEKAKDAARHAPDTLAAEFHKAEDALGHIAATAQEKSAETVELVETKAKEGVEAAKKGGKEGTSLLFWLSAAAGVVYFVILNDDQRTKVRTVIETVVHEAREIYKDIQGEDGKF
jgi:hypothetical protein